MEKKFKKLLQIILIIVLISLIIYFTIVFYNYDNYLKSISKEENFGCGKINGSFFTIENGIRNFSNRT